MRLQRIPFDRSGTPPGAAQCTEPRLGDNGQRVIGLDLVFGVFRAAEPDARAAIDVLRRYEPAPSVADVDEDVVTLTRAEVLDQAGPALIAATTVDVLT